jgi:hypothetical protein
MITIESTCTNPEARIARINGTASSDGGGSPEGGAVIALSIGAPDGGASMARARGAHAHIRSAMAGNDQNAARQEIPFRESSRFNRQAFSRGWVKK